MISTYEDDQATQETEQPQPDPVGSEEALVLLGLLLTLVVACVVVTALLAAAA
jgi:hypothetical protein